MGVILLLVVTSALLGVHANETTKKRYDGYKVLRVTPVNEEALKTLVTFYQADMPGVDFWRPPKNLGDPVDINTSPDAASFMTSQLKNAGIAYSEMIEDLQVLLNEEEIAQSRAQRSGSVANDFNSYKTYDELMSWLDSMTASCSHCSTEVIGKSNEGRDMKLIKIGYAGNNKPAIWIDCGIHAREWISPAAGMYIATMLSSNNPDSATRTLLETFDFYILPSANPDGYTYSHNSERLWRKTRSVNSGTSCRGTDPNRNWDFHWGETGASTNPCSETYMGSKAFSEKETEAMSNYLLSKRGTFKAYITLHSYGQYWLTPWGWTSALPETYDDLYNKGVIAANAIRAEHGKRFSVGSSTNLLYAAAGGSDDWAYAVAGCDYAYTPELRDTGRYGFVLPTSQIQEAVEETWAGVKAFSSSIVSRYQK